MTPNLIFKKAGDFGDHQSPTTEFPRKTSKSLEETEVPGSFPSGSATAPTPWGGAGGMHSETPPCAPSLSAG